MNRLSPTDPGPDVARDGARCANSLSGDHEAYTINIDAQRVGTKTHVRASIVCALCGVSRFEDFKLTALPLPDVNGNEITVENMTGRKVRVTVDGIAYDMGAEDDGTYGRVHI